MASNRETRIKSLSLPAIGGINQRVRDTELPPQDYPLIEGLFPEFAGLQSRLWGKRLLAKYAFPIYGIHQFWTPQGYGGGLYQFDGVLDFGQWLTPISVFDLTFPLIGFDGNGFTLDEFGIGGSNFGYTTDLANQPPPASTPNDSNGGPAGQGAACHWIEYDDNINAEIDSGIYVTSVEYGDSGDIDHPFAIPSPQVVPLGPQQAIPYGPTSPPYFSYLRCQKTNGSYWVFSGSFVGHQVGRSYGGKITFDLTLLEANPAFVGVTLEISQAILTPGFVSSQIISIPVVSGTPLKIEDYLSTGPSIRTNADGYDQNLFTGSSLNIVAHYRERVCT